MRVFGWALALALTACQPMTLTLNAPAAPVMSGGGGGAGATPQPLAACPVDFSDRLERAIGSVADRRARDSLMVQWRLLDKVVNASGTTEAASAAGAFTDMVDRLEFHGDLEVGMAARLKALVSCYVN
jgi:hypothetical protein